ncbi:putative membrane protein, partial [Candidatus Erwinia dacicola]
MILFIRLIPFIAIFVALTLNPYIKPLHKTL